MGELGSIEDDIASLMEAWKQASAQPESGMELRLRAYQADLALKMPDTITLDAADLVALKAAMTGRDVLLVKKQNTASICAVACIVCSNAHGIYIDCATWATAPRAEGLETRVFVHNFGAQPESETLRLVEYLKKKKQQGMIIFISTTRAKLADSFGERIALCGDFFKHFHAVMEA